MPADANKLVQLYIKIRDAKEIKKKEKTRGKARDPVEFKPMTTLF